MSTNQNMAQKILHRAGTPEVDTSADDVEIRKAGAKRLAKGMGKTAGFLASVTLVVVGGNHLLDNAETINRDYDQERIEIFGDTPDEPVAPKSAEFTPPQVGVTELPQIEPAHITEVSQ